MTTCASCEGQLVVEIEPDSDEEDVQVGSFSLDSGLTVPDDVQLLACGDHFHWECLLDAYTVTECPHCAQSLTTQSADGTEQIMVHLRNEGGIQENLDILPILTEEGYLKTFPEERKSRAFLEFCKEGDLEAVIALVMDSYNGESEDGDLDVLRYQDNLGDMSSALHAAIQNDQEEVAWCLLLLASSLDLNRFPPQHLQAAQQFGFSKESRHPQPDIRSLKDSAARTAADVAKERGGVWSEWTRAGLLGT